MDLSHFFLSLLNGYMEGKIFLSHILYLNSMKWMSKTHDSDICSVRESSGGENLM